MGNRALCQQANYLIELRVSYLHEYRCVLLVISKKKQPPLDTLNDLKEAKAGALRAYHRMTKPFVSL
jgi:hypothetical protein